MVYSSVVSAIGNIGQSSYGAANAYLDSLIEHRVKNGLVGGSIRWPAVSGMGMAAATIDNSSNDLLSLSISPSMASDYLYRLFSFSNLWEEDSVI